LFLNEHLTKITSVPPVPPDEKAPWLKVEKATPERNSSSRAHSGPSGKVGSEQAPKAPRQMQNKGPKDNPDPKLAAALAADAARNTGILGMLSGTRSSALAAVLTSDSGLGRDAADALGNLVANEVGDAYGDSHALGFVGTQRGGNGPLDGPIGLGNILGPGGDPRTRRSPPRIPALAKHTTVIPDVSIGPPAVVGMDKDLIRRVIRSHMNEVKFCYESELTRNNKLEGRVQVQFIIGTTGTVTNSIVQSSTLGNRTAESCIANAVRRWDFPRPQSGVASVSYPFVLKTAGE
jgi:TonB family protein